MTDRLTRRKLLAGLAAGAAGTLVGPPAFAAASSATPTSLPLAEFGYHQVQVRDPHHLAQRDNVLAVLTQLDDDSLLFPFRAMSGNAGQTVPGVSLGGWYEWNPAYDHHHSTTGLAPGHAFGQWTSALARFHAASRFDSTEGTRSLAEQATRLHAGLAQGIGPRFFAQTRFAGYTLDKLACGLVDAHRLLGDRTALPSLHRVLDAATPSLPPRAIDREVQWKPGAGIDWMWDETYTLPENFFLASGFADGDRFRRFAQQYLDDDTFFAPLARGENVLGDHHAYSYVNALCSAMQAHLSTGSALHLQAARNGFAFLNEQSFATGGWGPEETLRSPKYDELFKSLASSRNSFETPCGSYAHAKLTRYLLRATGDGRYGDSMERVLLNTVAGALPLQADGRSFYSQDCTFTGKRVYSEHRWPCCSGTLPQVVADRGINTFFHGPDGLWVNLYHDSEVRWKQGASPVSLVQGGSYLPDGRVHIHIFAAAPAAFALRLRVPAWVGKGASLRVNGRPYPIASQQGFTTVNRTWANHDVVELAWEPSLRLETFPGNGVTAHPEYAALLWGPLVLFALRNPGETGPLTFSQEVLLQAKRTGPLAWMCSDIAGSPRTLVPFHAITDQSYSTYLRVEGSA